MDDLVDEALRIGVEMLVTQNPSCCTTERSQLSWQLFGLGIFAPFTSTGIMCLWNRSANSISNRTPVFFLVEPSDTKGFTPTRADYCEKDIAFAHPPIRFFGEISTWSNAFDIKENECVRQSGSNVVGKAACSAFVAPTSVVDEDIGRHTLSWSASAFIFGVARPDPRTTWPEEMSS